LAGEVFEWNLDWWIGHDASYLLSATSSYDIPSCHYFYIGFRRARTP
jgi:hypothetical protein